jgi:hypothetical protein
MGLINHDYISYNGLQIKDAYICISTNVIRIQLDKSSVEPLYNIDINYSVYASFDAKNNQFPPLQNLGFVKNVNTIPSDLYDYSYIQLKNTYPNYSNC